MCLVVRPNQPYVTQSALIHELDTHIDMSNDNVEDVKELKQLRINHKTAGGDSLVYKIYILLYTEDIKSI
mgnify:CR=1 FL=1